VTIAAAKVKIAKKNLEQEIKAHVPESHQNGNEKKEESKY